MNLRLGNYSISKQLIKNTTNFLNIKHYSFINYIFNKSGVFYGWGRKKSGLKAMKLAKKHNTSFILLEDGFIRSLGLGVEGSPSFSLIEDDIGVYYDATVPSKLENILNTYDFTSDEKLMEDACRAIGLIVEHHISKYNDSKEVDSGFRIKYGITNFKSGMTENDENRVLVVAQTAGDASLKYGMIDDYSTDEMIDAAISENPNATVYLKVHPDVLSAKKKSDIDIETAKKKCIIIEENVNPISLLNHFSKVYTKTSGMGFILPQEIQTTFSKLLF
ncbi:MAG TPA: hypothetical protein EYM48_09365 [Campylobacterales bacterium]|nr:hypothetical protein [Campylobacterales bacterium]